MKITNWNGKTFELEDIKKFVQYADTAEVPVYEAIDGDLATDIFMYKGLVAKIEELSSEIGELRDIIRNF